MECPVCPFKNITEDDERCPNCGTNLSPLHRVSQIGYQHYNHALELANTGKVDLALTWACSAVALDGRFVPGRTLLGKILWRKKQFREALYHWEAAAGIEPENLEVRSLIEKAGKEIQASEKRRFLVRSMGFVFLAILLIVILFSFSVRRARIGSMEENVALSKAETNSLKAQLTEHQNTYIYSKTDVEEMSEKLNRLESQIAEYKSSHPLSDHEVSIMRNRLAALEEIEESRNRQREAISALLEELGRIDGVRTRQEDNTGVLLFEEGIFASGGDQIGSKASAILKGILIALKRHKSHVNVLIEGHTDDIPIRKGIARWPNNWSLGLCRANSVLAHMKKNLDVGHVKLAACSAGTLHPPFPNNSKANRNRNRTVLIYLTTDAAQAPL